MTQAKFVATGASQSRQSHSHNLSINSISSIVEPTTPPTTSTTSSKLYIWDANKLNGHLALPNFSLDSAPVEGSHLRQQSIDSLYLDKVHTSLYSLPGAPVPPVKIDKDYLASLNKVPLAQLHGEILRLAKDQYGCRFLQKRIDENVVTNHAVRVSNFETIFNEIHTLFYELIIDPFGNYLIQKLIDYCDETNLNLILEILQYNLFLISINQHGTRALQKVIDRMNNNYQLSLLIKGLKPYIIELIKDLNGNHVIQKILNKYSPENCQFIYDSIIDDLLVVATHKHGCCVLQKCLNHVNATQLVAFSSKVLQYSVFTRLINDQFGNYVLQYLISIDSIEVNCSLFDNFVKFGINNLCNLKFSSNVIEKLMKNCYNNEPKSIKFSDLKFTLISHILHSDMNKLINDPYGNYVIQTLVDIFINPAVSYFVDMPTGERVLLPSLQQLLPENYQQNPDSLQIQIIKNWFQNCKIISSFGKRIQLKINIILNGVSKLPQRKHLQPQMRTSYLPMGNQNMNANGEFVQSDLSMPPHHLQTRSMSLENQIPYNRANSAVQRNLGTHKQTQQHQGQPQYGYNNGYTLNNNNVGNVSGYSNAAPRSPTSHFESSTSSFLGNPGLPNLHMPNHCSAPPPNVSYPNFNQPMTNFSSNEFTSNDGDYPIMNMPNGNLTQGQYYPNNNQNRRQEMNHIRRNLQNGFAPVFANQPQIYHSQYAAQFKVPGNMFEQE